MNFHANLREEIMALIAWDYRNQLTVILNTARHSGKPYIDVESGNLHNRVRGKQNANHKIAVCCDVMRRMMRPGDSILMEPANGDGTDLTIRYILKGNYEH